MAPTTLRTATLPESKADHSRFHTRLLALFDSVEDEIATDPARVRHAFTRLVIEAAGEIKDEESARAFAKHFADKGAPYTNSRNGLAAVLLESWLIVHGGMLRQQFVETVLDANGRSFVATFLGKISPEEEDRMRTETRAFVGTWDALVREGDRDYTNGRVSDLTVYDCSAEKGGSSTGNVKPTTARLQHGTTPLTGPAPDPSASAPRESLLPRTRTEYERVIAEGGVNGPALCLLFERDAFSDVRVDGGVYVVSDPNGVEWVSSDNASSWIPRLSEVTLPAVRRHDSLRAFASAAQRLPKPPPPPANSAFSKLYLGDVPPEGAALRSPCESWAVFESPVVGGRSSTVVLTRDGVWTVPASMAEIEEAIDRLDALYAELPEEGDLVTEAFLNEYAADVGRAVVNHGDARRLAALDESAVDLRDRTVRSRCRLDEAAPPKEKAKPEGKGKPPPKAGPPTPPPPPPKPGAEDVDADEPSTTDRKERPPFYRDDLQRYFDLQKALDKTDDQALAAVKRKFKLTADHELEVTPAGEVRANGIVDDPEAPKPASAPPAPGGMPPPPTAVVGGAEDEEGAAPAPPPQQQQAQEKSSSTSVSSRGGVTTVKQSTSTTESEALPLPTLDSALAFFLTHVDAYLEDFPDWIREFAPHLANNLETWQPSGTSLTESELAFVRAMYRGGMSDPEQTGRGRLRATERARERRARALTDADRARYKRWEQLANSKLAALLTFHTSEAFAQAFKREEDRNLARQAGTMLARMKTTPVDEWTDEMWNWCGRQMRMISRLRSSPGGLIESGRLTHKYLALRAFGHDPVVRDSISLEEVTSSVDLPELHRRIDALSGPAPHPIGERTVDFAVLRKHRTDLSDDERAKVLKAGAVWHMSNRPDHPVSAVWKAAVGDKTYYVVNTHRAYKTAETLDGAIAHFPAIKKTA